MLRKVVICYFPWPFVIACSEGETHDISWLLIQASDRGSSSDDSDDSDSSGSSSSRSSSTLTKYKSPKPEGNSKNWPKWQTQKAIHKKETMSSKLLVSSAMFFWSMRGPYYVWSTGLKLEFWSLIPTTIIHWCAKWAHSRRGRFLLARSS